MTYTLRFLPEVEDDAVAAYIWYEQKARGLGEEFLRTFYMGAQELLLNPLLYPTLHPNFVVGCFGGFHMPFTSAPKNPKFSYLVFFIVPVILVAFIPYSSNDKVEGVAGSFSPPHHHLDILNGRF